MLLKNQGSFLQQNTQYLLVKFLIKSRRKSKTASLFITANVSFTVEHASSAASKLEEEWWKIYV